MWRMIAFAMLLPIGVTATAGSAADSPTLEDIVAAIDAASAAPDGLRVVAGHISRKLGISVEVLQSQRAQTGLGWGQLLVAHHLARETGLTVEEVAARFRLDKGWTAIARDHDLDLARLTAEVQVSREVIEQRAEDRARTNAPPVPPSRAGKGGGKGGGRRQVPQ
jgi:hypothetical protein